MAPDVEKYTQRYLKDKNIDDMEWTPGMLILTTDWFAKLYIAACFVQWLSQRDVEKAKCGSLI